MDLGVRDEAHAVTAALIVPGGPIRRRLGRSKAPFVAGVEIPRTREVRGHTGRVARFSGWVASRDGRPTKVRATVAGTTTEFPVDQAPPELDDVEPDRYGHTRVAGFSFYVDVPPLSAPLPVDVLVTDGEHDAFAGTYALMPDNDLMCLDTYIGDPPAMLELAARHLRGRGLEFGALHAPLEVDRAGCEMHYADKMSRAEAVRMFFDLHPDLKQRIVEVDHVVDLDRSDLAELEPHGYDFFVANGVVEHLANPLAFLVNLHRTMKPGALAFISVPDRDFAFDVKRDLTSNEHLLAEYEAGVTELDDQHVYEAVEASLPVPMPTDPDDLRIMLDWQRGRSVHAHVWTDESFLGFLRFARERAGVDLELVDHADSRAALGNVVVVLRKPSAG